LRQKPLSPEAKEILDQTTARMLSKTPTRLDAPTPPQGEEVIRQALSDDILRDREGNDARLGAVPDSDSIAALVSQNEDLRDAVKRLTAELTALREEVGKKEEEISEMASSAINVASERWKEIIALRAEVGRYFKHTGELEAELTALRSQLSEAQENYEKVWDAAVEWSAWTERKDYHAPPDKTTFINNLKKGKE
jgi:uncharacterized coiled-coil DUF342 family protein